MWGYFFFFSFWASCWFVCYSTSFIINLKKNPTIQPSQQQTKRKSRHRKRNAIGSGMNTCHSRCHLPFGKPQGKMPILQLGRRQRREQKGLQIEIIRKEYRLYNPGLQSHTASAGRREGILNGDIDGYKLKNRHLSIAYRHNCKAVCVYKYTLFSDKLNI